ncbi:hypothetical protein MTP99_006872 [Tenebrio molitor]|nr:hypothetical protein MTP99_006872 [Tenebrio molitor]
MPKNSTEPVRKFRARQKRIQDNMQVNMKVKDKVLVDPGTQELQLIAGKNIDNIVMKTVNVFLLLLVVAQRSKFDRFH